MQYVNDYLHGLRECFPLGGTHFTLDNDVTSNHTDSLPSVGTILRNGNLYLRALWDFRVVEQYKDSYSRSRYEDTR